MQSSSSILVTGSTGFIGNALVNRLIKLGMNNITCLVRSGSNYSHLLATTHIIPIETFTKDAIFNALNSHSFEYVFHLAAYGVKPEQRQPLEMLTANIEATAALLLTAENWPLKRFIYTGSCSEYSPTLDQILISENHPIKPSSLYGGAKAATSIYAMALATQLKLPLVLLRLFGVYGPGESDYRLIPYLIKLLKNNQPVDLTLGEQTRDFLYIDDVVDALLCAAMEPLEVNAYNICSSEPIAIREIALKVANTMDCSQSLLNFGARTYRSDETMWIVGDNTLFKQKTHWNPCTALANGIERMIAQYKEIL